jgi:hypothetical protein
LRSVGALSPGERQASILRVGFQARGIFMSFSLVAPERFTARQQQYLEKFRQSIYLVSSQAGAIVGAKDIHS